MAGEQAEGLDSAEVETEGIDSEGLNNLIDESTEDQLPEDQVSEEVQPETEPTSTETEVSPETKALQDKVAELEGRLANSDQIGQFYQTQYNELIQGGVKTPDQETQDKDTVTAEELAAPPETWESTNDVVNYFDKRNESLINKALDQRTQEFITPMFQRANMAINALIDHLIKPIHEDWDEVIKDVNNEIFVMDPTGQNIVSYRNPGLLQYFQNQALPILAMYEYGKGKRSSKEVPDKIKNGIKKGTRETLKKISEKSRGPVSISSKVDEELPELTVDTPHEVAEKILAKRGLIPK